MRPVFLLEWIGSRRQEYTITPTRSNPTTTYARSRTAADPKRLRTTPAVVLNGIGYLSPYLANNPRHPEL